jgi:hypothetical protein
MRIQLVGTRLSRIVAAYSGLRPRLRYVAACRARRFVRAVETDGASGIFIPHNENRVVWGTRSVQPVAWKDCGAGCRDLWRRE